MLFSALGKTVVLSLGLELLGISSQQIQKKKPIPSAYCWNQQQAATLAATWLDVGIWRQGEADWKRNSWLLTTDLFEYTTFSTPVGSSSSHNHHLKADGALWRQVWLWWSCSLLKWSGARFSKTYMWLEETSWTQLCTRLSGQKMVLPGWQPWIAAMHSGLLELLSMSEPVPLLEMNFFFSFMIGDRYSKFTSPWRCMLPLFLYIFFFFLYQTLLQYKYLNMTSHCSSLARYLMEQSKLSSRTGSRIAITSHFSDVIWGKFVL